ncbi:hypothetical protein ACIQAD_13535 [Streptomyces sp. NPDC088551]|uniref:hypothetical protein n=1 Tax=Streptomyces sp. NPDC088551 TaxID=3365863 RepID=UPI0037FC812C
MTRYPSPTENVGCLRGVLAVPLVLLHLIAAGCCSLALTIRPAGTWDDDARAGMVLACVLTLATSALALLITVAPSVRRAMGPWWSAPPLLLGAVAAVRWALVD